MKRTDAVNFTILGILILFILLTTLLSLNLDNG